MTQGKKFGFRWTGREYMRNQNARERLGAKYEATTLSADNTTIPPHLMSDHLYVKFMENYHKCK